MNLAGETGRATFLVVEDDRECAEGLAGLIRAAGHEVRLAGTLEAARAAAEAPDLHVAIVDLGLPDGRGTELLHELRERRPDLLLIVVTGAASLQNAREAIRCRAIAWVEKGDDPAELERLIRSAAREAVRAAYLRETAARYERLVERAPLGIALVRGCRFTFVNQRFASIFGLASARDLVGRPVTELCHPQERQKLLGEVWQDHDPWEGTFAWNGLVRADGQRVDVVVTRSRVDLETHAELQLVVRDTTHENRLSSELEAARLQVEERRRLALLGELAAEIAHEVRNPLQAIVWGLSELRASQAAASPDALAALRKVDEARHEIETIVEQVLDHARPMRLERLPFRVLDLLEAARDQVTTQAGAAGVQVDLDAEAAPERALVDGLRVKQALVNLLQNAVSASPPDSSVLLRASACGSVLVLQVLDEGPGVPPDLLAAIQRPFVTTKVEGTGLGLAVVRRVVEAHGGSFQLLPRSPRGTAARIELPDPVLAPPALNEGR